MAAVPRRLVACAAPAPAPRWRTALRRGAVAWAGVLAAAACASAASSLAAEPTETETPPLAAPAPLPAPGAPPWAALRPAVAAALERWRAWPPLDLTLRGTWHATTGDAPLAVRWQLVFATSPEGLRHCRVQAEGPGLALQAELTLDAHGEPLAWALPQTTLDLAAWAPVLVERFAPELAGFTWGGTIEFSGGGGWRAGQPQGPLRGAWREGSLQGSAVPVTLTAISAELDLADIAAEAVPGGQWMRFTQGQIGPIALGAGELEWGWDQTAWLVPQARLHALGGAFTAGPLRGPWDGGAVEIAAHAHAVDLATLVPFLPAVIVGARGHVGGELTLRWQAAAMDLVSASLALAPGTTAELRFNALPGVLSQSLPPRVLSVYTGLRGIEEGRVPLHVSRLDVLLTPGGDAEGRSGIVHLEGGPTDPALIAPLALQLNLRGPLGDLVRQGSELWGRF